MAGGYVLSVAAVLASLEATPGVFTTPNSVLPLERIDGLWEPKLDKDESNPSSGYHGAKETTIIADFATIEETLKFKMPSDHTLIAPLLNACSVEGSAVESVGTVYKYNTNSSKSLSLREVGKRRVTDVSGVKATFTLSAEVGKAAELNFEVKGQLVGVTNRAGDEENSVADTPDFAPVFMTKECSAYLLNGNQAHFKKVEFKLGGEVVTPKDTCPGSAYIKDIKPELTLTMAVTPANEDAFNDLKSGSEFNVVIPFYDVDGNKKYTLQIPKCVAVEQKSPDSDGLLNVERTLECRKINGDDSFEIIAHS